MSISEQELLSIGALSFVPQDIEALCQQSRTADGMIKAKKRGKMLSKLFKIKSLCPESLNPDDTILNKMARGDIGPGTSIIDDYFAVINDRNMPLGGTSCGPNGVLFQCNSEMFGQSRINLFGTSVETTLELARSYVAFRNARLPEIFRMYVSKMCSFLKHWKIDPGDKADDAATLSEEMRPHYTNTCELLSSVQVALSRIEDATAAHLNQLGISVVSFCQTWQKDTDITEAQFSVMSPHFQTRFYVSDETKLPQNAQKYMESYSILVDYFTSIMLEAGYAKSFVHVDKLIGTPAAESAFHSGIPANSTLIGIGPFTTGITMRIQSEHPPNASILTGRYKLVENHHQLCKIILQHVPTTSEIKKNMIIKLCGSKTRSFENVSKAIIDTLGVENKILIDNHMLSPLLWKVVN